MSVHCMGEVFKRYHVGGGEFVLALALADHAHEDGSHIFAGIESLAKKSRQSTRAVQMHLRAMVASGWLLPVRSGGGRGKWAEYRISPNWLKGADIAPFQNPAKVAPFHAEKGAEIAPFQDEKGCNLRQERVQNDAQKGAKQSTPYITVLTVIEPSPLPPAAAGGADAFEQFFAAYPRKVGKGQARQEWAKLSPDEALCKRIESAVRAWARSPEWARNDGQFIPKPVRWLREQRWEDVPGVALAPSPTAPPPRMVETAPLTPEQLKANGEKARAAAALARKAFGVRAAPSPGQTDDAGQGRRAA